MIDNLRQEYDRYTEADFTVWKMLFERQMIVLPDVAAPEYLAGIEKIGFSAEKIPDFREVNERLLDLTGWQLTAVPGIIDNPDFFRLLVQKKFPASTWLRKPEALDYLPEPDMFHDVFGHVPLLTDPHFCSFYETIGALGTAHIAEERLVSMLSSIYWFTVEFGLIHTQNGKKIYGAGILSSHGETEFSLSNIPEHFPFDAEVIMNTPYQNDRIQNSYFVIDSFSQLLNSSETIASTLEKVSTKEKYKVGFRD